VIFSEPYAENLETLRAAREGGEVGRTPVPIVVTGTLESNDPPKILVRSILRLDQAEQKLTSHLRVRVLEPDVSRDRMLALREVLRAHPGDRSVFLHITIPGESETVVSVGGIRGVNPSDALRREVDGLFGRPVAECGL
jgi:hypothetical protein